MMHGPIYIRFILIVFTAMYYRVSRHFLAPDLTVQYHSIIDLGNSWRWGLACWSSNHRRKICLCSSAATASEPVWYDTQKRSSPYPETSPGHCQFLDSVSGQRIPTGDEVADAWSFHLVSISIIRETWKFIPTHPHIISRYLCTGKNLLIVHNEELG